MEPLVEGRDYVWEGTFMVLTRDYLLRRGYCCGNGCRNCPYLSPVDNDSSHEEAASKTSR